MVLEGRYGDLSTEPRRFPAWAGIVLAAVVYLLQFGTSVKTAVGAFEGGISYSAATLDEAIKQGWLVKK